MSDLARSELRPFTATPTVAGDPYAASCPEPSRSAVAWRRLRRLGIAAPVVFIVAVQLVRPLLLDEGAPGGAGVLLDTVTAVAAIVFGLVMFRLLERWSEATLRSNRELAVRDAVATSVRDAATTPDAVATAAARAVRDSAGALRVLLDMPGQGRWDAFGALDPTPPDDARANLATVTAADVDDLLGEFDSLDGEVVTQTIPLMAASAPVGTLRLWLPDRCGELSPATLDALGQQIGSALHRGVLALAHARLLEKERNAAAVREREWIAREMHDSLAQTLGVLHLRLRALEASAAPEGDAEERREFGELAGIAHDAFIDVREAILGLRENAAADRSFLDALTSYVAKYARQSGMNAHVLYDRDEGEEALALAPNAEVQALRIVQEALTNTRKHAGAERATVTLWRSGGQVHIEVADDGVGFEMAAAPRYDTFGLTSMRERCELVGGELRIDSSPGRGTRVTALLPASTPPNHPHHPGATRD